MSTASSNEIAVLDSCDLAIAKAERLSEVTELRSQAEAIRVWARSANKSLEVQNRAAELRLRAERKAGTMLSQMHLQGGDRKSKGHGDRLVLADLGVTPTQSKRWQKEASVSDQDFAEYVHSATILGKEITAAGLMRLAPGRQRKKQGGSQIFPLRPANSPQKYAGSAAVDIYGESEATAVLQEAINHVNLLQQVLVPYAKGQTDRLTEGDRRAVVYYLEEVKALIQNVNEQAKAKPR